MARPSPTFSATIFPVSTVRQGNDGNVWQVVKTADGKKKRWVKLPITNKVVLNQIKRTFKMPQKTILKGPLSHNRPMKTSAIVGAQIKLEKRWTHLSHNNLSISPYATTPRSSSLGRNGRRRTPKSDNELNIYHSFQSKNLSGRWFDTNLIENARFSLDGKTRTFMYSIPEFEYEMDDAANHAEGEIKRNVKVKIKRNVKVNIVFSENGWNEFVRYFI